MKPIRLRVENFLGLRELDLEFPEHGVFVITGRNGAGKSSILEAMYFALYGIPLRASRASSTLINRNAAHSTDRPAEARIVFVFSQHGSTYEVQRILSKKVRGDSAEHDAVLYQVRDGIARPLQSGVEKVNRAVEKILGLKPEVFASTVLLGQGKVTELIEAKPEKRREIFDSILETEYLDRAVGLVREDLRAVESEVTAIEDQISALRTERSSHEISHQLSEVERSVQEAERQLSVWQGKLANWQQIESLRAEISELESRATTVEQSLGDLRRKAEEDLKIRIAKALALEFSDLDQSAREIERIVKEIDQARVQSQKMTSEVERIKLELAKNKEELTTLGKTDELLERRGQLSARLIDLEAEKSALQVSYEKLKLCLQVSNEVRKLASDLRVLENRVSPIRRKVEALRNSWSLIEDFYEKIGELSEAESDLERIKAEAAAANHELKEVRKKMKELLEEFPDAVIAFYTNQLLSALELHQTCPICGNEIMEFAQHTVPDEALLMFRSLEQRRLYLDEVLDEHRGYESAVLARKKVLEREIDKLKIRFQELTGDSLEEAESLEILEERIKGWQKEIDGITQQAQYLQQTIEAKREQLRELSKLVRSEYGALLQSVVGRGKKISERIREAEQEILDLRQRLAEIDAAIENNTAKRQALENRISSNETLLQVTTRQLEEISETIREKEQLLNSLQTSTAKRRSALEVRLAEEGISLAEFATYRNKQEFGALERVQNLEGQAAQLRKTLEQKRQQLASVPVDVVEGVDVKNEFERWNVEYKKLLQRQGELRAALDQALASEEKITELERHLSKKLAEREVLATLSKHLGAKAFPDFYRSVMITEIIDAASGLLGEMTEGRFSLAFEPETFRFVVFTDEGQASDTHLLSGGEKVLVSLAVAFAISQHFAGSLESIFVDEGFAQLDKDNNTRLAEYLLNLEDGAVLVGIITHSEEFAVNFNRRLFVSNGRAAWA
ncbi:SMC family ATPase [Coprothermobacteraceae bacterium]|nr:SMC family ATPase [Coprothermobacteraceae bacterium]